MSANGWRALYWLFVAVGVVGVVLAVWTTARLLKRQGSRRTLITSALAVFLIGVIGIVAVAAAAPGNFGRNMMGMGGMGMMGGGGGMMDGGSPGRSGSGPSPGAPTITVTARDFSLKPSVINVRVGETVNIVLKDDGSMFHTFTISALGFDLRANAGDSISGALKADRAGTFQFICSVPGHAQLGMRGQLIAS